MFFYLAKKSRYLDVVLFSCHSEERSDEESRGVIWILPLHFVQCQDDAGGKDAVQDDVFSLSSRLSAKQKQ